MQTGITNINIIHRFIRHMGRELRRVPRPLAYEPYKNLKATIPLFLAYLKLTNPNFRFIQVGSNDGLLEDPLHRWIVEFDLGGIMIEPQPEMCESLRAMHSGRTSITVLNAAISDTNGTRTLFRVPPALQTADWLKGCASFRLEQLEGSLTSYPSVLATIEAIQVPTITPTALMAQCNIGHIGALIMDVEGYDYELLKLFAQAGILPPVIQYEHRNLSRRDWESSVQMLISHGYDISFDFEDTIACHARLIGDL